MNEFAAGDVVALEDGPCGVLIESRRAKTVVSLADGSALPVDRSTLRYARKAECSAELRARVEAMDGQRRRTSEPGPAKGIAPDGRTVTILGYVSPAGVRVRFDDDGTETQLHRNSVKSAGSRSSDR
jgi:hypothetical protein